MKDVERQVSFEDPVIFWYIVIFSVTNIQVSLILLDIYYLSKPL